MWSNATAVVAATLVVGCAGPLCGIASADPPAPPPPQPNATMDHDGTYTVGTDIPPGTYSSGGPVGDGTCYWKRVSGNDVADNALSKKPQVVQIQPGDTAFKTDGCQPWQLTPDAAVPQGVPPLIAGAQIGGLLSTILNPASQPGGGLPPGASQPGTGPPPGPGQSGQAAPPHS
jgi:hypothetical protein